MMDRSWLVADPGDTNARFAIAESDNRKVTTR
jgi:glucokinase